MSYFGLIYIFPFLVFLLVCAKYFISAKDLFAEYKRGGHTYYGDTKVFGIKAEGLILVALGYLLSMFFFCISIVCLILGLYTLTS